MTLPPSTQTWVPFKTSHREVILIDPHARLFSTQTCAATNHVAQMEYWTPFKRLLANFVNNEGSFKTGQTVAWASPQQMSLIASTLPTADVLGLISDLATTTRKTTIKPTEKMKKDLSKACHVQSGNRNDEPTPCGRRV